MFRVASIRWYTHIRVWASERSLRSIQLSAYGSYVQTQKRAGMESRRRVCVNAGLSPSLSSSASLKIFLLDAFIHHNVISTTGAICKEMREGNLSTNTQVAAAGIICRSERERESALDECNQMEFVSLSIPHALDNFNQHTHADEIKESDQCFFFIHFSVGIGIVCLLNFLFQMINILYFEEILKLFLMDRLSTKTRAAKCGWKDDERN